MENGEITKEPLKVIDTDVLVTYVMYDHENDHLEKPGWKHPRTYEQALGLDRSNENTFWGDASIKVKVKTSDGGKLYQLESLASTKGMLSLIVQPARVSTRKWGD
jgi:hypothetical protein